MAHPLRLRILDYMNERAWSPRELEQELGEGLSQISYHVTVLKDLDMIRLVKTTPRRGAVEHYYEAIERAFIPSSMAKEVPQSAQQVLGNEVLGKIEKDLSASMEAGRFYARPDWHVSWTPVDLDDQGCKDAEKLGDEFAEGMLQIEAESVQRRAEAEDGGEHIPTTGVALVFGSEKADKRKSRSRQAPKKSRFAGRQKEKEA